MAKVKAIGERNVSLGSSTNIEESIGRGKMMRDVAYVVVKIWIMMDWALIKALMLWITSTISAPRCFCIKIELIRRGFLPNEVFAVATEDRLFEEALDELVILNFAHRPPLEGPGSGHQHGRGRCVDQRQGHGTRFTLSTHWCMSPSLGCSFNDWTVAHTCSSSLNRFFTILFSQERQSMHHHCDWTWLFEVAKTLLLSLLLLHWASIQAKLGDKCLSRPEQTFCPGQPSLRRCWCLLTCLLSLFAGSVVLLPDLVKNFFPPNFVFQLQLFVPLLHCQQRIPHPKFGKC